MQRDRERSKERDRERNRNIERRKRERESGREMQGEMQTQRGRWGRGGASETWERMERQIGIQSERESWRARETGDTERCSARERCRAREVEGGSSEYVCY